jgi:murein DD-endopeptidase MepM/ murein hydrolase activator NlpD
MSENLRHRNTSFSYKSIHPTVRRALDSRSALDNTVQVAMPFVKATTTLDLYSVMGSQYPGCVGFTLGTHMYDDTGWENLYAAQTRGSDNSPLIGYTYSANGRELVYASRDTETAAAINLLETGAYLEQNVNASFIPPPGITSATVGRNRNGLIISAQINVSVPHLLQLEALHRTFFVPGVGMILEWGQKFAPDSNASYGEYGPVEDYLFPWDDAAKLGPLLRRLGEKKVSLQEILQCYTYPTQGQYSWMFGRVGNFSVKGNADGSFDCMVKIVGPSEDAWAYTTTTTVIPARINKSNSTRFCPDTTNSVESYLTKTSDGLNLKTLLSKVYNEGGTPAISALSEWAGHVKYIKQGNKTGGDDASSTATNNNDSEKDSNPDQTNFADSEDAFFMTWRFFVNVVLNDLDHGIKAIFRSAGLLPEELDKVGVIRPYKNSEGADTATFIIDPLETYVGSSEFLRSKDPSTLIIVNKAAVDNAIGDLNGYISEADKKAFLTDDDLKLADKGDFRGDFVLEQGTTRATLDKGFLSTGVWINHKAVCHAMLSAQTVIGGITNLLTRMNSATVGYWRLSLDPVENVPPDLCGASVDDLPAANYQVIDANYRENAKYAVENFIDNVHIFNKYIRRSGTKLVGSELTSATVSLDLPKRMFTQIATMGLVQQSDIDAVTGQGSESEPDEPAVSDPNETLRKMFAITTLSTNSSRDRSPDLTIPPYKNRRAILALNSCGGQFDTTGARTDGNGNTPRPTTSADATAEQLEAAESASAVRIRELQQQISDTCGNCPPLPSPSGRFEPDTRLISDETYFTPIRSGVITRGTRPTPDVHKGVDIAAPPGTPVFSAAAGVVRRADIGTDADDSNGGFGSVIEIDHPNGTYTRYGHLSGFASGISVGTRVTGQQLIGFVGNTGISSGPHLHFEIRRGTGAKSDEFLTAADDLFTTAGPANNTPPPDPSTAAECNTCNALRAELNQQQVLQQERQQIQSIKKAYETLGRDYPKLQQLYIYVEALPAMMVANIARRGSDGNRSNAFGAAPGTLSIAADFEMPGISGLRIGELFWLDRMPTFYRAFGAFQIISIEDTIGLDGWKTKIHSRFNFLGTLWKEQMLERLRQGIDVSTRLPPEPATPDAVDVNTQPVEASETAPSSTAVPRSVSPATLPPPTTWEEYQAQLELLRR